MAKDEIEDDDSEDSGSTDDVSLSPNENADPQDIVDRMVPALVRTKYEVIGTKQS